MQHKQDSKNTHTHTHTREKTSKFSSRPKASQTSCSGNDGTGAKETPTAHYVLHDFPCCVTVGLHRQLHGGPRSAKQAPPIYGPPEPEPQMHVGNPFTAGKWKHHQMQVSECGGAQVFSSVTCKACAKLGLLVTNFRGVSKACVMLQTSASIDDRLGFGCFLYQAKWRAVPRWAQS